MAYLKRIEIFIPKPNVFAYGISDFLDRMEDSDEAVGGEPCIITPLAGWIRSDG